MWVGFGDDDDFDVAKWGPREIGQLRKFDGKRFELFPRGFSPFQDGWEAVLVDDGEQETLVWRQWRGDVGETHELSLPQGEFTSVITLATDRFRVIRRSRVGTEEETATRTPSEIARFPLPSDNSRQVAKETAKWPRPVAGLSKPQERPQALADFGYHDGGSLGLKCRLASLPVQVLDVIGEHNASDTLACWDRHLERITLLLTGYGTGQRKPRLGVVFAG